MLPGLVLDAFEAGSAVHLARHLAASPERQFTTLDCHDGIPVRPDLDGILPPESMLRLAEVVERRGGNINRILSEAHADGGVDVHQLNCTYFSALGCDDDRYLAARAIQLFARGIPQVYYVGLLGGANDLAAVGSTGDGRAVNRHDYGMAEIEAALATPLVQRLSALIALRNRHPAFGGTLTASGEGGALRMTWRNDAHTCDLEVDLAAGAWRVTASNEDGGAVQMGS